MFGIKKIIFILLAPVAIFIASSNFCSWEMAAIITLVATSLFLSFFKLNSILTTDTMPPDMFNDTRRNFDYLLLGSTRAWKYIDQEKYNRQVSNRLISFANYKRNLFADFFILQRMFSYLHENGTVIISIDPDEQRRYSSTKLTYADLRLLHPLTLSINGFNLSLTKKKYPLFFYPAYSVGYLFHKLKKDLLRGGKWESNPAVKFSDNIITLTHENLYAQIEKMVHFCNERGLDTKIACIVRSKEAASVFRELEDRLQPVRPGLEIVALNSYQDFEGIISHRKEKQRLHITPQYKSALFNLYFYIGVELLPYAVAV